MNFSETTCSMGIALPDCINQPKTNI